MTLLVLGGARFDLAVAAERVRRVLTLEELERETASDASTGAPGVPGVIDLFARLEPGRAAAPAGARVVVVARSDGRELLLAAPSTIEIVTANAPLALPPLCTRGAPWLKDVVPDPDGPDGPDGPDEHDEHDERPLFVVDPERL